ncbi:uncharacterized protein BDW70DRAFT_168156 [Aspergillus foveolatus]|uniref:uncharacterized protein n=1 Tax=Aspergillus foveolatus TaxID=210207 RepID=UPI003CCDE776
MTSDPYDQILRRLKKEETWEACRCVLSAVALAYRRPLHLAELGVLSGLSKDTLRSDILPLCGSLLTIQDGKIDVEVSAKDYLNNKERGDIFPSDLTDVHRTMFLRSLQEMSLTLQRNMYNLHHPGVSVNGDMFLVPDPDPLAAVRYSCAYWISHFCDAYESDACLKYRIDPDDGKLVDSFLRSTILYWLEALSLIQETASALPSMQRLEVLIRKKSSDLELLDLVQDSYRFVLWNISGIKCAPLQVYASALVFSPALKSLDSEVRSVSFSRDLRLLASASFDRTVKIWDTATGSLQRTLDGHNNWVMSAVFSHDAQLLASASDDRTVKIWDTATGSLKHTLGHDDRVTSAVFSHDSRLLASALDDRTVKIWDTGTGSFQHTLEGHSDWVRSDSFSHNSRLLASASDDATVKIWDTETGFLQHTLEGHDGWVRSVVFSHNSRLLASASDDGTVKIWDTATGSLQHTLEGHSDWVRSVSFSHDSRLLASASDDATIWDTGTGSLQHTLEGHDDWVTSAVFSHDSRLLASASDDRTVKIWNAATGTLQHTFEGLGRVVISLAFSHTSNILASAADGGTVNIWDMEIHSLRHTFELGNGIQTIQFDRTMSYLITNVGRIKLDARVKSPKAFASSQVLDQSPAQGHNPRRHGYGLSGDLSWITWNGDNVLWLPPGYRPFISTVSVPSEESETLAIGLGNKSGRVVSIRLSGLGPSPDASLILAKKCIEYLRCEKKFEESPLLIDPTEERESIDLKVNFYVSREPSISPPQKFPSILDVALYLKLERLVLHLLEKSDFRNQDNLWETMAHEAAVNGYELLLDKLVKQPNWDSIVNKRSKGMPTPLYEAAKNGHRRIVSTLLDKGAKVNEREKSGRVPLHEAAANGHAEVVHLLLENDAKIDEGDEAGRVPLHEAAAHGRNAVIEILLGKSGSKVAQRDKEGRNDAGAKNVDSGVTVSHGQDFASSTLPKELDDPRYPRLRGGTDIMIKDRDQRTPLHHAAKEGHLLSVSLLLSRGALVDIPDIRGHTPLYLAAINGRLEAAQKLLSEGANFRTTDQEGRAISVMLKEELDSSGEEVKERLIQVKRLFEGLSRSPELYTNPILRSESIDSQFSCAIIDFVSGIPQRHGKSREPSIDEVISGRKNIFKQGMGENSVQFRWLHLPVNNLLMLQYSKQYKSPTRDLVLRDELWMERLHKGAEKSPHARFMRPVCQEIGSSSMQSKPTDMHGPEVMATMGERKGGFVILMPYVHWEYEDTFEEMHDYAQKVANTPRSSAPAPNGKHQHLMRAYMTRSDANDSEQSEIKVERRPVDQLHFRRSLDQYYYHALESTKDRDKDQLVSRMFKDNKLKGDPVLIVVDQLWLWVLENNTVITSFPERWNKEKGKEQSSALDTTDVLENIIQDRSQIKEPHHLAESIICKCLTSCLDPIINTRPELQFLEFYEGAIGQVTNEETQRFRRFCDQVAEDESIMKGPRKYDPLDILTDVKLLEKIKDIRDELHTLMVLFRDQEKVIREFEKILRLDNSRPKRILEQYMADVKKMDEHAIDTYNALNHLLDLKQKHANLQEARSSRRQADDTAKQGDTLLVFTLVTIIFLPLSFMAAFFAIDIVEFPKQPDGLHLDFVSSIMFSVSAAIVLPLVIMAFNVNKVSAIWGRFAKWIAENTVHAISSMKVAENMVDDEKKLEAIDSCADPSAGIPPRAGAPLSTKTTNKKPPNLSLLIIGYFFVILPIQEFRFAFDLLCRWQSKFSATTHLPEKMRRNVKYMVYAIITIIRLCVLPLWLAVLCVDITLLIIPYGMAYLLFKDMSVRELIEVLRRLWVGQTNM